MKMQIKLELDATVELPLVPNFLKAQSHPGQNVVQEHCFDIKDISEKQLEEIGKEWTRALVVLAQERRKKPGSEKVSAL